MRIALVSNWNTETCGVANFGRDWKAALERAGHTVLPRRWDDPLDGLGVERVYYNWHPATAAPRPASVIPYAVYLHDIPPWSSCGLSDAVCYFTSEPYGGGEYGAPVVEIGYPVYDGPWVRRPVPLQPTSIGWTGLRGDGRGALEQLCARRGWVFNGSDRWRSTPAEVSRLSASTLIVLWYFASDRGQSLALSTACATGRPVLVNGSKMFRLADRGGVIRADGGRPLESALDAALDAVWKGTAPATTALRRDYGWTSAVKQMEAAWNHS